MLKEQEVKDTLRALVEEKGYHHQAQCAYTNLDGSPRCIVGHLLARLEPEVFATLRDTGANHTFDLLVEKGIVEVESNRIRRDLDWVQAMQDGHHSWGYAVNEAYPGLLS